MTSPVQTRHLLRTVDHRTRITDAYRTGAVAYSFCDPDYPLTLGREATSVATTSPFAAKVGSADTALDSTYSLLHPETGLLNNRKEATVERSRADAVHRTIDPMGNPTTG